MPLKISQRNVSFHMSGLTNLNFPEFSPYEAFFSKIRNNNPLDKNFIDYEAKLQKNGCDEQRVMEKLQIKT